MKWNENENVVESSRVELVSATTQCTTTNQTRFGLRPINQSHWRQASATSNRRFAHSDGIGEWAGQYILRINVVERKRAR
jgi:hypothetical protein